MRLAFIGGFGHHYLRGALTDASMTIDEPVAYAPGSAEDKDADPLAKTGKKVQRFADVASLLRDYRPDVVSVGTVFGRAGDVIAQVLEQDLPVVSDKPVATTWEQLERLRNLTRGNNRVLLTEFDFRSRPSFRAARQAVLDGRIGQPVLATAQKSYRFGQRPTWYKDRTLYGGIMLWVASHAIDAIRFVTGRKFLAATGRQANVSRPEFGSTEEYCTAMFELDGGATGIVHADFYRPDKTATHGDDRLRVAGTQGVVEVRGGRCLLLASDGSEQDLTESVPSRPMHAELLAAIRGETREYFSTEASLEMAEILLRARDAADKQQWIRWE
jgi:predicted dehydrogenase